MSLINIAAFLSTVLAVYSIVPYLQAILKGRTKPHQFSWLVFVIMNGIVFFSQYLAGGRGSVLVSLTFFIGSMLILLFSLKYGVRDSSKWDRMLFVSALCTIVVWVVTKNNEIAIWLTLVIDLIATAMIVLKVRSEPYSEDPYPWTVAAVAYIFSCLTLVHTPLNILYVRPLYGLVGDALLVAYIYYRRGRTIKNPSQ